MAVLKKISVDFLFKLEELNEEKYDFYRNTYNMAYEKRLPYVDQDAIRKLIKLKPKMYYIFSCLLSETNFIDATYLKLGIFIDFFYHRKGIYMTSIKSLCLIKNKEDALLRFDEAITAIEEGDSLAFRFYDRRRKIRINFYEFVEMHDEDEDGGDEDEDGGDEDEEEEYDDPTEPTNGDKTFFLDKCVACREKSAILLFATCGHVSECVTCNNHPKRENKNQCLLCRKESNIIWNLTKN